MELTGNSRWGGSEDKNTEAGSDLEMGGTPQRICGRKVGRQEGRKGGRKFSSFSVKHKIQQRGAL